MVPFIYKIHLFIISNFLVNSLLQFLFQWFILLIHISLKFITFFSIYVPIFFWLFILWTTFQDFIIFNILRLLLTIGFVWVLLFLLIKECTLFNLICSIFLIFNNHWRLYRLLLFLFIFLIIYRTRWTVKVIIKPLLLWARPSFWK